MAEAEDLKSSKCGFDPHPGHTDTVGVAGQERTMKNMKSKRLLASLLLLILSATTFTPVWADTTSQVDQTKPVSLYCDATLYACNGYTPLADEQYLPPWTPAFKNVQGYYHNDLVGLYRFPSYAVAVTRDSSGNAKNVVACKNIADSNCIGSEIHFRSDLPMCTTSLTIDCISDINILDKNNKPLRYELIGEFPLGNPQYFIGSVKAQVPNGGGATLIRVPAAPHNGGDTYLVKAEMTGSLRQPQKAFTMKSFALSITAVKIVDGKFTYGGASTNPKLYVKGFDEVGDENGTYPSRCAIASPSQCAEKYSLPMDFRFGMTVELSRKITGWLHGRVKAPEVTIKANESNGSTLSVQAEPIRIPINAAWVSNDQAPQSIKDFYKDKPNYGSPLFGSENKSKPLSEIALMRDGNTGHTIDTFTEYLSWLSTLGDKAQALPTAWTIQTMSNYQVSDQIRTCLNQSDSLSGMVTTNAAEYLDGPPRFDKNQGTLDYKVAATHLEPDGKTVFKGTYDLIMSSSVARCIYSFSNAPISATISVTSENNDANVAVTQVSEKLGWLSLSAYNFTYSSPTIRVKLSGTPVPAIKPKKISKITCVRGKTIRVVTAKSCPSGFKKR